MGMKSQMVTSNATAIASKALCLIPNARPPKNPAEVGQNLPGVSQKSLKEQRPVDKFPTVQPVERLDRILLIEDDERIGASLTRALEGSGYRTFWAKTAHEGEQAFRNARTTGSDAAGPTSSPERTVLLTDRQAGSGAPGTGFDLVLLDIGLPDADGLDVCRRLVAADPLVPIIMLTARDEELDLVVGLDAGATDYITKPFSLASVLARIRAHLRRNTVLNVHAGDAKNSNESGHESDRLHIEVRSRRVYSMGVEIILRAKEFDLLARLAADTGSVVTRETLMADVWDENWFGSTKTLDFHIAALRTKFDRNGEPSRITTIRGVGFRFEG
jgi:DNA-binding response OmpR family regulator